MQEGPAAGSGGEERTKEPVTDAVRMQILATEHWSLLASRQLAWTEAFSRATIFLTVLSAVAVALALVGQADDSGRAFRMFALLLLPVVLFLGVATYVRLCWINEHDYQVVIGMNRLRRGYLDIAPDLEPYFVTGSTDDRAGLLRTAGISELDSRQFAQQALVSTPAIVGVVDCVLAGVLGGLVAEQVGLSTSAAVAIGFGCGLVLLVLLSLLPTSQMRRFRDSYRPKFPS